MRPRYAVQLHWAAEPSVGSIPCLKGIVGGLVGEKLCLVVPANVSGLGPELDTPGLTFAESGVAFSYHFPDGLYAQELLLVLGCHV